MYLHLILILIQYSAGPFKGIMLQVLHKLSTSSSLVATLLLDKHILFSQSVGFFNIIIYFSVLTIISMWLHIVIIFSLFSLIIVSLPVMPPNIVWRIYIQTYVPLFLLLFDIFYMFDGFDVSWL